MTVAVESRPIRMTTAAVGAIAHACGMAAHHKRDQTRCHERNKQPTHGIHPFHKTIQQASMFGSGTPWFRVDPGTAAVESWAKREACFPLPEAPAFPG